MVAKELSISTEIPPMVDPMGRYWKQPSLTEIIIDEKHAVMASDAFNKLADYSASRPTGSYAGKMWKVKHHTGWYLRWYEDDPDDKGYLLIPARLILIVDN